MSLGDDVTVAWLTPRDRQLDPLITSGTEVVVRGSYIPWKDGGRIWDGGQFFPRQDWQPLDASERKSLNAADRADLQTTIMILEAKEVFKNRPAFLKTCSSLRQHSPAVEQTTYRI